MKICGKHEQNGYYAAQDFFCVREFIKTGSQLTLLHGRALVERSSGGI